MLHEAVTDKIIKAYFKVYNSLGYGFLEKVYENALLYELQQNGFKVQKQRPIKVHYFDQIVGEYFADLIVDDKVIIELKSAESISDRHIAQLMNYLKATHIEVGLVMNFGPKPGFNRRILTNDRKPYFKNQKNP